MLTVMIADDEAIERDYLKSILQKYPAVYCLIHEAANGEQAVEAAFQKKPDIIVMDIKMPLLNGLEAAIRIKARYEHTVIILNSAYSEFDFAQKALHYELDAYLLKPAAEHEIIDTIEGALRKKKFQTKTSMDLNTTGRFGLIEYPYEELDRLIDSIRIKDLKLSDASIQDFLEKLRTLNITADEYRLFVINAVFNIMRSLNGLAAEEDLYLIEHKAHLDKISQAHYWHEIYALAEEFLTAVFSIVKSSLDASRNFSGLVEKYIEDHYKDDLTLEKLADVFHFSPAYLSRKFHQDKGCTINDFIRSVRVGRARSMIENSDLAIREIALKCGFSNISHFNRVFKAMTGKTPSEYKTKEDLPS